MDEGKDLKQNLDFLNLFKTYIADKHCARQGISPVIDSLSSWKVSQA